MSLILTTAVLASALAPLPQEPEAPAAQAVWVTDWEAAKAEAQEKGKDLLIDFTGSDWCVWCKRLKAEVFDKKEFQEAAPKSFVLVELDFPNDKSGQSEELQAQNQRLMEQFGVEGFPTIFLADAEGRPYAKTGYQEGGAESYVEHLDELRSARESRDALVAKAGEVEGVERAKLLAEALDHVPADLHKHYMAWIDEIISLDPDNAAGLAEKFEKEKRTIALEGKLAEAKSAMNTAAQAEDWAAAGKVVDDFLAAHDADLEGATKHEMLYYRAMIAARQGDFDMAIQKLEAAKQAVADHPMNERIDQIIEQMKKQKGDKGGV